MAEPGTDAAEGDESRSAAPVMRATGWRIPSVLIEGSGLPEAWINGASAPAEHDLDDDVDDELRELEEFGRAEAMVRRWRGWSFSVRRHQDEDDEPVEAPVDIDLVALAAADEFEPLDAEGLVLLDAEHEAWTDLTLAALEDTDSDDDWALHLEAGTVAGGPWSILAEELQGDQPGSPEPAPDHGPSTARELEEEFWARGTR